MDGTIAQMVADLRKDLAGLDEEDREALAEILTMLTTMLTVARLYYNNMGPEMGNIQLDFLLEAVNGVIAAVKPSDAVPA